MSVSQTPGDPFLERPASEREISTGANGDDSSDDAEARRQAAALARSGSDQRSRADAAFGEADEAQGRAVEAAGRGDIATAEAEWSDAAGLDGLAAHDATGADIDARAAAAAVKSPSVPAAMGRAQRVAPVGVSPAQGRGPVRVSTPVPGVSRRNGA